MLYGLEPGLQKCFETPGAYEMFQELKLVFQTHARVGRYETCRGYTPRCNPAGSINRPDLVTH